jgi:hypothetical protein
MPSPAAAYPDRLAEWLFSLMMMAWGVWLLVPQWSTFVWPQYSALSAIAPEPVWGVWSVTIGAVRATGLYINGSWGRTPLIRLAGSSLGMIWWLVLIFLFLLAPQRNPPAGYAFYPLFVVFEGICCWRSAADAFHSRAFARPRLPRIFWFFKRHVEAEARGHDGI